MKERSDSACVLSQAENGFLFSRCNNERTLEANKLLLAYFTFKFVVLKKFSVCDFHKLRM